MQSIDRGLSRPQVPHAPLCLFLVFVSSLGEKLLDDWQKAIDNGLVRIEIVHGYAPLPAQPDHRHRSLLRACRERPRRCAAEQRDKLASLHHSISSSARPDSGSGTVTPSVLAALRLMNSSTFVACCTGRSEGFSPLTMRPA